MWNMFAFLRGERVCSRSSLTARLQISHLSRKQFKELCLRRLLNSFWCPLSGQNPFWNEIQLKFCRINISQFVKIWTKAVGVKALWSYSWSTSGFLGHFYWSWFHFQSSLILPFCTQFAEKRRCEDYSLLHENLVLANIIKHAVETAVNNFSFMPLCRLWQIWLERFLTWLSSKAKFFKYPCCWTISILN